MESLRSSFRRFRRGRNVENGSVRQCDGGDHCDCCDIKTIEETYTVTVENNNAGSKVCVGDKVVVYKTDNINISPKENTVVQLERDASMFFVQEMLKRADSSKDQLFQEGLAPNNEENLLSQIQKMSISDLIKKFISPPPAPAGVGGRPSSSTLSFPLDIDGELKNETIEIVCDGSGGGGGNNGGAASGTDQSDGAMEKSLITFKIHRSVQSKVPKVRRRQINGVLLSICGAFGALPVAMVILWLILSSFQNEQAKTD